MNRLAMFKRDMVHLGLKDGDTYAGMVVIQIPRRYDDAVLRQDPSHNYLNLRGRKGARQ